MENTVEDILCTRPPTSLLDTGTDPALAGGRLLWPELMNEGGLVRKRPGPFVYARRMVFNGVNAALLGATFLSSVAFQSMVPLATFMGAQALLAVVAPRVGWFRRSVNRRIECEQEAVLARHRAMMLMQMSERHRHVFEAMEMMARRIRSESVTHDGNRKTLVNVYLEVERLLATYATLALIHRKTHDHLTLGAANLRQTPPPDPGPGGEHRSGALDSVIARRNEIQRRRRAVRECNQERMVTMEQQMGAIQDLICLVYEHVATDRVGAGVMAEIEEVLQGLARNEVSMADWEKTGDWQPEWVDVDDDDEGAEIRPLPLGERASGQLHAVGVASAMKSGVLGGAARARR